MKFVVHSNEIIAANLTIRFISCFYWNLERKEYLEKMDNLSKHHGAGRNAAESVALA